MRRIARLILAGALLNIVIAWALVVIDRPALEFVTHHPMFADPVNRWPLARFDPWEGEPTIEAMYDGFGRRVVIYAAQNPARIGKFAMTKMYEAGWPMQSMRGAVFVHIQPPMSAAPPWTTTTLAAIPIREPLHGAFLVERSRVLPILPKPVGFGVNTALIAATLGASGAFHRWNRRRRGRCAWCGYDVGELEMCPECGRVVGRPKHSAAPTETVVTGARDDGPETTHG